jgi:diaminopimelate decarboxylase
MTFDNEDELEKIAKVYPEAELVLRILADDSHSVCRLGLKFGAPLSSVGSLLLASRRLGLNVIGISYHVGSGNTSAAAFGAAVKDAKSAFDTAAALGFNLTLLDMGGGFPGSVHGADLDAEERLPPVSGGRDDPYAGSPSFRTIAAHVRAALTAHFPPSSGVTIMGEPGRFFVKSSHALAVSIIGKRRTVDEAAAAAAGKGKGERLNYYVNDGLYGSFNCFVYDHATASPSRMLSPSRGLDIDLAALARRASNADAELALENEASNDAVAKIVGGRVIASDAVGLAPARALAGTVAAAAVAFADERQQREKEEAAPRLRMVIDSGSSNNNIISTSQEGAEGNGGVFSAASGGVSFSSTSTATTNATIISHGVGSISAAAAAAAARKSTSTTSSINRGRASITSTTPRSRLPLPLASAEALLGPLPSLHPTTLWGPTCDSFDKIDDSTALPDMATGDWLIYENMGAYTIAGSCKFNGFPLSSKVYLHQNGKVEVTPEEVHE